MTTNVNKCEWVKRYPGTKDSWAVWYVSACNSTIESIEDIGAWNHCPYCSGEIVIKDEDDG